jgi:ribosomal-protein-alanine N-acetyltransferase
VGASARPDASAVRGRVLVRELAPSDEAVFVALAEESLDFHRRWIKTPTNAEAFRKFLLRLDRETAFCFVICDLDIEAPVGYISLTGIEREPYCRGRLGYGIFEPYARMGYMKSGIEQVIRKAFQDIRLHRLEADIQPANHASRALIEEMGFVCEGVSRGFIRINDVWQDHERWALTRENWRNQTTDV